MLDRIFPLWRERNIGMFYILTAVYNMWFVGGVWVFVWGKFMTTGQIGISDALTFSVGFIFELPSGVIADLMGRKKAILLGNILLTTGNFLIAFSSSFGSITLWYLVWTIGFTFQSGATEALAYDSLKKVGKENKWQEVIATTTIINKVASLTATALGGLLYGIWFRLPYLVFAITGIIGITAAYLLKEFPVTKRPDMWSAKTYFDQIKSGISILLKSNIFPVSLISLTIASVAYLYNWGLLRPLTGERFGYSPMTFPLLLALTSVAVIVATLLLTKLKLSVEKVLFASSLIYGFLFLIMGFDHRWLIGGTILIFLAIAHSYVDQMFSRFINSHTQPQNRATTLSAVTLFTRAPYVFLAILIGSLAEKNLLPEFTFIIGALVISIWSMAFFMRLKRK